MLDRWFSQNVYWYIGNLSVWQICVIGFTDVVKMTTFDLASDEIPFQLCYNKWLNASEIFI